MKRATFLLVVAVAIAAVLAGCGGTTGQRVPQQNQLTAADLFAEHQRLAVINIALSQGQSVVSPNDYPKVFGTYKSREVSETYFCGDVCPQYGQVVLVYSGVSESACSGIEGDAVYSYYWGSQFQGCSPLTVRYGTLQRDGASAWSIVGETVTTTRQSYSASLVFNDASECRNTQGTKIGCGELEAGQTAIVIGTKSGASIVVLRLDLYVPSDFADFLLGNGSPSPNGPGLGPSPVPVFP